MSPTSDIRELTRAVDEVERTFNAYAGTYKGISHFDLNEGFAKIRDAIKRIPAPAQSQSPAPSMEPSCFAGLVEAGLRHVDGLTAQLAKPDWMPRRSHIEQARNSIHKLAEMLKSISRPASLTRHHLPTPAQSLRMPDAWIVDGPMPFDSSEVFLTHDKALEAFNEWGKRITPLYKVENALAAQPPAAPVEFDSLSGARKQAMESHASMVPAAPVETERRYTEKEVAETVEKVISEMLAKGEIADTRSHPRSSAGTGEQKKD